MKLRINKGQEFVVGGYIPGPHGIDSIIVGYYRGEDLQLQFTNDKPSEPAEPKSAPAGSIAWTSQPTGEANH